MGSSPMLPQAFGANGVMTQADPLGAQSNIQTGNQVVNQSNSQFSKQTTTQSGGQFVGQDNSQFGQQSAAQFNSQLAAQSAAQAAAQNSANFAAQVAAQNSANFAAQAAAQNFAAQSAAQAAQSGGQSSSNYQQSRTVTTTHNVAPAQIVQNVQSSAHEAYGGAGSQQTQLDYALQSGGAVNAQMFSAERSDRSHRSYETQLRSENDTLRAEVHRLRKIEHAWRPPGSDEETRVFVVNNYQHQINQNISEINNLKTTVNTLQQQNADLQHQLQHANPAPNYAAPLEDLRERLRDAQREIPRLQGQLNDQQEREQSRILEEREKWSRIVEEARGEAQRLRNRPPPDNSGPIRDLQQQLQDAYRAIEHNNAVIVDLEAQLHLRPPVERVYDEAGLEERDRLLDHYKFKWDEVAAENAQLKAWLTQSAEDNVKVSMRSELSTVASAQGADLQREREYQVLLQEEVRQAKEELRFVRAENQRLRDMLLQYGVRTTEIRHDVFVDNTGSYIPGMTPASWVVPPSPIVMPTPYPMPNPSIVPPYPPAVVTPSVVPPYPPAVVTPSVVPPFPPAVVTPSVVPPFPPAVVTPSAVTPSVIPPRPPAVVTPSATTPIPVQQDLFSGSMTRDFRGSLTGDARGSIGGTPAIRPRASSITYAHPTIPTSSHSRVSEQSAHRLYDEEYPQPFAARATLASNLSATPQLA